jgi:hypothetical protein
MGGGSLFNFYHEKIHFQTRQTRPAAEAAGTITQRKPPFSPHPTRISGTEPERGRGRHHGNRADRAAVL